MKFVLGIGVECLLVWVYVGAVCGDYRSLT